MNFDRVSAFRTAEGQWQATVRKGPNSSVSWFHSTLQSAIDDAAKKLTRENCPFDISHLLD